MKTLKERWGSIYWSTVSKIKKIWEADNKQLRFRSKTKQLVTCTKNATLIGLNFLIRWRKKVLPVLPREGPLFFWGGRGVGRFLEHFLKMDLACSIFFNIKSKTWKVESTWSILFPCLPLQLFFLCRNIVLKMATQLLKKTKGFVL